MRTRRMRRGAGRGRPVWSSPDASRGWCSEAEAGGSVRATEGDVGGPACLAPWAPGFRLPISPREVIAGLGRRPSGSLRGVQRGLQPHHSARALRLAEAHGAATPPPPRPARGPTSGCLTSSQGFHPMRRPPACGGRCGGGGAARVVRAVGGPALGGGPRGPGVHGRCGAQGHTDTRRPRAGSRPAFPLPSASLEQERLVSLSPPSLAETVCWKADRLLASSWHRGLGLNHK